MLFFAAAILMAENMIFCVSCSQNQQNSRVPYRCRCNRFEFRILRLSTFNFNLVFQYKEMHLYWLNLNLDVELLTFILAHGILFVIIQRTGPEADEWMENKQDNGRK